MDYFLWLLAFVSQAFVGFLGVLAIKSDLAARHYRGFVAAFIVLTLIALTTSSWGFIRASNSSSALALLTEQILYVVNGAPDSVFEIGPNFTKSQGGDYDKGQCTFQFFNDSKYPMVDTRIGIVGRRYVDCPEYGRPLGDIPAQRGGTLPGFTALLSKEKGPGWIQFSIDCRATTMWATVYFLWNGKGWISDTVIFKELAGREVYIRELRPNSPFAEYVDQEKKWAAENAAANEQEADRG